MAYTYRFLDSMGNIIYVGYTGQQLETRMHQHFTKGHLDSSCYKSIARIEYIKYGTKSDAQIMETYYINKYKPRYNVQNKRNDTITIELSEKEWKLFRQYKSISGKTDNRMAYILVCGMWLAIVYYVVKFILSI